MKNLLLNSFIALITLCTLVSCSNDDDVTTISLSNAKLLTSFQLLMTDNNNLTDDVTDFTINEPGKSFSTILPYGTDVTSLTPTIEVSANATISPTGAQDFTNPVTYTVTAEDETTATYTVAVNVVLNTEKQISSFIFLAVNNPDLFEDIITTIDEDEKTISVTLPYGIDITSLIPTIEISEDATITQEDTQNSTNTVYTVTAQNGITEVYSLNTQLSQKAVLITIYNSSPKNALGWDITSEDISSWKGVTTDNEGNVTQLEINSTRINNIPAEISQLTRLTHLSLKGNRSLTSLPPEIGELTNLTNLYINYTRITSLPNEIAKLTNLKTLYISENNLISVPEQIFQLTSLTVLGLNTNDLISIPSEIGLLTNLTKLKLSYNELTSIPNEIGELTNLTELRIDYNKLSSIPVNIGNLTNLTELELWGNNLTSLPPEIGQLTKLPELILYSNNLTTIPKEIGKLQNLNILNISRNNLTSIPPEISQLSNLTELSLYDNQLTEIPNQIGNLTSLTVLYLIDNNLTTIPQTICDLNISGILIDEGVTCETP